MSFNMGIEQHFESRKKSTVYVFYNCHDSKPFPRGNNKGRKDMGKGTDNKNPIFRSIGIIEERIQEKLTVENLANSIHFSKYHYQRVFREVVGDSVMRYVTKRRLSLAAEELAETDTSVLEIALKYGFDSHEGFSRSFRAYLGVTPTEYRKYHLSVTLPKTQKERCVMLYSKTTNEIIRELNSLIVQSKETAMYTRKYVETAPEVTDFYLQFGNRVADRADGMADELTKMLDQIASITHSTDEISARFLILKILENAAFQSRITAFHVRLMITRAKPEHRTAFEPICAKYDALAQNAQIKADRIAIFFNELASQIFCDMREQAKEKLGKAVEQGKDAANRLLNDSNLPYTYIANEIMAIADELSLMPLEEVTVSLLEDYSLRLDVVAGAVEMDVLRMPSHKALFCGISDFREQISEAAVFFQSLWDDVVQTSGEPEKSSASALAFQGTLLLFYLKGEIQKLELHLNQSQKAAFDDICEKMSVAIHQAYCDVDNTDDAVNANVREISQSFQNVHAKITLEAEKLGIYGGPIQFIADEIKRQLV